ncbi:glycoside hydrolase family 55 protein [Streptomyces sp. DSM 41972]|uniref:Glycoside hydrolase family 55 protein n=1 Tax=Streptomyces althioticus subsp. attaecolombicae TaxID=3075534 RepID=A0ABU3HW05_9ACTN|nr:glycoside hydrolase family 55 protein [Streptomyces sp. DSM 41972]SCD67626.1 Right handed beta helix region [Streptomyces sp. di50b]SCD75796.1 Right handed beta helix region [Streptomyces sp. di188]
MSLEGLDTVTVTGQIARPGGEGWKNAYVTFTAPTVVTTDGARVLGGTTRVPLPRNGHFSVDLLATDADGIDPTGWTYEVKAYLTGVQPTWTRHVSLPKATPSVALGDVLVADPVEGDYAVLVDPSGLLAAAENLGDLQDVEQARGNLGLGSAAVLDVGTAAGTVAAGNDGRLTDWRNVRATGAVGDGTADDTAALQSALDAAGTAGGGVVFLPAGTYRISEPLQLHSGVTLLGAGSRVSLIEQSADADGMIAVDGEQLTVHGLAFAGPGSGSGAGIRFTRSASPAIPGVDLYDVRVSGFGSYGVELSNPIVSALRRVRATQCGGAGLYLHGVPEGAAGTSTVLTACYADQVGGPGIWLQNMAYASLVAWAADHGDGVGYRFEGCQSVTAHGCGAESNAGDSFEVAGGYGVSLLSCWAYDNHAGAFHVVDDADTVTLIGCTETVPDTGATGGVIVDAGSTAVLVNCHTTTADNLIGRVTEVDAAGGVRIPGTLALHAAQTIVFGPDGDTNLYRSGADALGTDDSFAVGADFQHWGGAVGFFGTVAVEKPTASGSWSDGSAGASLAAALATLGLITDSTTA